MPSYERVRDTGRLNDMWHREIFIHCPCIAWVTSEECPIKSRQTETYTVSILIVLLS